MTTVLVPKPHSIPVEAGKILKVTACAESDGYVIVFTGRPDYVHVSRKNLSAGDVQVFGPYPRDMRVQITANRGAFSYEFVTDLEAHGLRVIPVAKAQELVAQAIVERNTLVKQTKELEKQMRIQEKSKALADLARQLPDILGNRLDQSTARLRAAEAKGHAGMDRIDAVVSDVEAGATVIEDTANQLSNGAPLGNAADASKKPAAAS